MEILPGGSAQQSGELKANDRILAVGQGKDGEIVDVVGWRLDDVVQLIRGPGGSFVRLQIQPGNAAPGTAGTRRHAAAQEDHARGTGRQEGTAQGQARRQGAAGSASSPCRPSTRTSTPAPPATRTIAAPRATCARLIDEFQKDGGIDGLVLDLRENGGGHLSEAIGLVNLFVPKGPVVQLRETGGTRRGARIR